MGININSPLPSSLASECRKAARILNSFTDSGKGVDFIIPPHILADAKGLAIFTVLKAGFLFSGRAGSGLVVARLHDGTWSAPSAIITGGMGFGGQVGAELTDFIMVLNTSAAVKSFMDRGSITLGGNISVAAGPVGRNAEASGTASIKSIAAVYSYSKTRGLFAGVSLEGSVIIERFDANAKLYGHKVKGRELLNGSVPPPPAADELYRAIDLKTRSAGAGHGRFGYMDANDKDGRYAQDPYSRYDDGDRRGDDYQYNSRDFEDNNNSRGGFDSPASSNMSFSRSAVRTMAKTGLSPSTGGGNRARGYSNSSWDNRQNYEPSAPRQITHSSSDYDSPPSSNIYSSSDAKALIKSRGGGGEYVNPRARALFNFKGEQEGDLPFSKDDIITITKKTDTQNDWWTGVLNGREGIFPANFVEIL